MSSPETAATREITFGKAINEALAEELRRDERVFVIGEDVAEAGTPFKVLSGLVDEFGTDRVIDSPISEAGITGLCVGAAMTGMRPVVDIMFGDFLTLVMDQLVNQAAKAHYMSGGSLSVPLVLRTTLGATRRSAAQHSQSLQAWVSHMPGLKVVMPSTPADAKGLLKTAIRDDNPVVFIEDKLHYPLVGEVPEGEYTIPLGVASIKRAGDDVTIVATSSMVQASLEAAELLAAGGISAEVIDPRTTSPLDHEMIIRSVQKTGRSVVVDEGHRSYGVTAEIAAMIAEEAFYHLDAPVRRLGARDVPIPFSPPLEDVTVPTPEAIAATVSELVAHSPAVAAGSGA
ncbi:MAG TPA: alpha-ketoacid dehydrogenase subunit beta [Gaiellales bacterium]|nr:alpha-ketoacid dehydrogenase subunit beta [Gaiellales bacterium]